MRERNRTRTQEHDRPEQSPDQIELRPGRGAKGAARRPNREEREGPRTWNPSQRDRGGNRGEENENRDPRDTRKPRNGQPANVSARNPAARGTHQPLCVDLAKGFGSFSFLFIRSRSKQSLGRPAPARPLAQAASSGAPRLGRQVSTARLRACYVQSANVRPRTANPRVPDAS